MPHDKPLCRPARVLPYPVGGLLLIILSGLASLASAHDYRLERAGDALLLYQGHLYSSHTGEDKVAYDAAIVKDARCVDRSGGMRTLPKPDSYPARFDASCAVLWVQTSSGYWSQTLTGTVNRPRTEAFGALRSWLSEESIKHIQVWLPSSATPLGTGLELTPADNPLALKAGAKLRLKATWQGRPKPGVVVAYDGEPRGATDADGQINIRLRHGGLQLISASFEEPLQDVRADKAIRATVLQFQLAE
jgi:nickel transport protein